MFDLVKRRPSVYNPLRTFEDPDSIFSRFFGDFGEVFGYDRFTNADGDLVTEIEIPGYNKDTVSVELTDGILTVKGERTSKSGQKHELFKRLTVSQTEEVDATIADGVLTLVFKQPKKEKTKIEVK